MRLEDRSEKLAEFLSETQNDHDWWVEKAKKAKDAFFAEKAKWEGAISDLKDQTKAAKAQLDGVLKDLGRASGLAGLDQEVAGAQRTLEGLKSEIGQAEKTLAKLKGECSSAERARDEANEGMGRLRQERADAIAEIAKCQAIVKSWGKAA
jgi:chromosome segregation ATPase